MVSFPVMVTTAASSSSIQLIRQWKYVVTHRISSDYVYSARGEITEPHYLAVVENMNTDSCVILYGNVMKRQNKSV